MKHLLTKREAAARIGKSTRHLERMIFLGKGPPFIRTGIRGIAFDADDIDAWLTSRRIVPDDTDSERIST